ncbi:MAG TPA: DGQHR domain-containing protein DpdB [Chloroflexota bacterium]
MHIRRELIVPAIEVRQTHLRRLYSFAIDGKVLHQVAAISRIHRENGAELVGYQRPEVLAHIAGIRAYLESDDPMLPNAIVVAFDPRVTFKPIPGQRGPSRLGRLIIPVDPRWPEDEKPGWIVDGQQRSAAIRDADLETFPICVTAFITESMSEQRAQFILVNSTKPLPKGLVYELLPGTDASLPRHLRLRRQPAVLVERLNHDVDSPLRYLISTPTNPEGKIKDNSMLRMLENSLSDGALYGLRDPHTGRGDVEEMLHVIKSFWEAVRWVFTEAFGKPPRHSRLMHGVGVISLGFVMDAITERYAPFGWPSTEDFASDLSSLAGVCCWTSGTWDFDGVQRRWNDLQNTPKDVQLLADYLLSEYRTRVLMQRPRVRVVGS